MKHLVITIVIAILSGCAGAIVTGAVSRAGEGVVDEIKARKFTLVDSYGRHAAMFTLTDAGPVLTLIDPADGKPALAMGVEHSKRFIVFYQKGDMKVMELVSSPPSGMSRLSLGDNRIAQRVHLGADNYGELNQKYTDDWTLRFVNPHNWNKSIFQVYTSIDPVSNEPFGSLELNEMRSSKLFKEQVR